VKIQTHVHRAVRARCRDALDWWLRVDRGASALAEATPRRGRRKSLGAGGDEHPGFFGEVFPVRVRGGLDELLDGLGLPPGQSALLHAVYGEGLSLREVAALHGRSSPSWAHDRLRAALCEVRKGLTVRNLNR
jgi:hypothetical protein